MNPDFVDLFRAFVTADVRFLIGRDAFIRNKRATGRPRDLADLEDI